MVIISRVSQTPDMDGTTDVVFLTCPQKGDCQVNIIYNKQIPLCALHETTGCRSQSQLCTVDPNFELSANPSVWTVDARFLPCFSRQKL